MRKFNWVVVMFNIQKYFLCLKQITNNINWVDNNNQVRLFVN